MDPPLTERTCPKCGAFLEDAALDGLCPQCVGRAAFLSALFPAERIVAGNPLAFDGYELLEEIARGGMGVVFKARQIRLKRVVALKTLLAGPLASQADLQRFRAEAEAAAHLQHPNIVAIHEVGEREGLPFFSMDYVEGQSLAELGQAGPLEARRAAGYVKTVAQAIAFAHQRGIVHRDLKPSNVLIDSFDQPRVTDFGLAKRLAGDLNLTRTGQVLGTPNFMAPEQADARHEAVGPPSDIYSIGAILYFLLTAQPPFQSSSLEQTLERTLHSEAVPPSQINGSVPRDLETICLKCLEKIPARRYATAQELADDLDRFLRGEPIVARPVHWTEKAWRWGRRRPAVASLAASLTVTMAALLAVLAFVAKNRNPAAPRASDEAVKAMPALSGGGLCGIIGGKVFVTIPEIGYGGGVNEFYSYDPARNLWSHALSATPVVHKYGAGGVINGRFYLAGGSTDHGTNTGRLEIYDPDIDDWATNRAPMPTPRCSLASSVLDGKLYVIGGQAGTPDATMLEVVEIYDPKTDHWSAGPPLRPARRGAGAVVIDQTLYVVGGYGRPASSNAPIDNLDALGADGAWVALPSMLQPAGGAFVAAHDGTIYVAGGQGQNYHDTNTLQAYSIRDRKWTMLASMPESRWNGCGAQWINGELYVFGGWTRDPPYPHDTMFVYDPRKNSWRQ